ncbi:MAG: ABC transporter permease [Planctomycetaceae bacterium]
MDTFTIMFKDLRLLSRDRRALVILVAMPMVIIAIVGSSTGRLRANREKSRQGLTIEVADFDQSETAIRLAGFLAGYENVILRTIDIAHRDDTSTLKQLESERPSGDVDMRLVIQPGFEEKLAEMSTTQLLSGDKSVREKGLQSINLTLISNETAADPMMEGLGKSLLSLSLRSAILPLLVRENKVPMLRGAARDSVIPEPWAESEAARATIADTGNRVYQFFIPSYTVLFVFFLVNIMGRSFLGERDTGTLRRLRISPIAPVAILMGKTLPFFVLSLVQTTILMVSGRLLFGMSWGPQPLLLIPIMLCTSAAATALGLMFATLAKTESQVSSFGNLILLSSAGISGCLVPRAWMPPLSQKISLFTPHAWALDAYSELLTKEMPNINTIAQSCGMLLLFSSAFFIVGMYRFRADG